ncbi:hypothetical protein LSM04_004015 [Trypanosoma melophagium]|uniref:uncharacterized protein n=1 Tax=Trypanosoma melophagium TaxID=715481 RepID=UPI00351AB10E|nr:hypothetical protein LSM04_004015 [Trypanosoma melophagium]
MMHAAAKQGFLPFCPGVAVRAFSTAPSPQEKGEEWKKGNREPGENSYSAYLLLVRAVGGAAPPLFCGAAERTGEKGIPVFFLQFAVSQAKFEKWEIAWGLPQRFPEGWRVQGSFASAETRRRGFRFPPTLPQGGPAPRLPAVLGEGGGSGLQPPAAWGFSLGRGGVVPSPWRARGGCFFFLPRTAGRLLFFCAGFFFSLLAFACALVSPWRHFDARDPVCPIVLAASGKGGKKSGGLGFPVALGRRRRAFANVG